MISGSDQYSGISGNVGIGTSTPAVKLDVLTSVVGTWCDGFKLLNSGMASGNNYVMKIGRSNDSYNAGYLGFNYDAAGSTNDFLHLGLYAANYVLCLNGAGNVGIGTTSPGVKLVVNGIICGGTNCVASGSYSHVGGGSGHYAQGDNATVAGGAGNYASGTSGTVSGGENNRATSGHAYVGGGLYNRAEAAYAAIGSGYRNRVLGDYSAILGGCADTIAATADYSYLFGINSDLTQDSTFMVDMPHIRFGSEAGGYEFPTADGASGQAMVTDGSGMVSWTDAPANDTDWVFSGGNIYSGVSGNVGIGTSSPAFKLHVIGDMAGTGDLSIERIVDGSYYLDPDDIGWSVYVAGNMACAGGMHIGSGGSVSADNLIVDGNTGLGTSTPSQRLHVNGNMRLTGAFYDGNNGTGTSGQMLSSTRTNTDWIDAPPHVSYNTYNVGDDVIGSGWTKIEFNTEDHDDGSDYDNTNDRFTASSDGVYHFSASVTFNNLDDATRIVVALYKNGARYMDLATGYANTTGSYQSLGGSATIKLVTDDYIEVYAYTADATTTIAGSLRYTNFSGHQIY